MIDTALKISEASYAKTEGAKLSMSEHLKSAIMDELINLDKDQLLSTLSFISRMLKGEPEPPVATQIEQEEVATAVNKPKKRRVKNPYSLASRLGQTMRSLSEPRTPLEIFDIMKKMPGLYRPTDTVDAIRKELRRQRITSYHEVDVDTWIHQSGLKKNQAA